MTASGSRSSLLLGAVTSKLKPSVRDRRALGRFIQILTEKVARRSFVCLLANDKKLQELNRVFLGHDYPTDVLSFPSDAPSGPLGEIAISMDRAALQANEFGHSLLDEVRILMLHGVLHLTGLDHEKDRRMAREENRWRAEFALPETLIARAAAGRKAS